MANKSIQSVDGIIAAKYEFPGMMLLIILAAFLPYLASLQYGFVYDDDVQVLANPGIRAWSFVPAYFTKPIGYFTTITSAHYYRPMDFLWLRLNYFLFGTHPWGWHLANIGLHVLASLLVFVVLRRYFQDAKWAAVGALIFAVHPAHIETVSWISGFTDAALTVSLLGSLYLWMRCIEKPSPWRRIGSITCCALAVLTKETAIILPIIIFFHALAGIPAKSPGRVTKGAQLATALREAAPYLCVTAAYVMIRFWVLHEIPNNPQWISKPQALLTMPSLALFYLGHLVWPLKLSIFYDLPVVSQLSNPLFWVPVVLLCGILIGVWIWFRHAGDLRIAAAVLWILLPLLPVLYIGVFQQDDWAHDRYLYLPVLGLSVLCGMLCEFLWRTEVRQKVGTLPLLIVCLAIACLGIVTVVQARPWESNLLLYGNATRLAPKNTTARNNLASEYLAQGRYQEAGDILKLVLADRPGMWLANYNYGLVNYRTGNLFVAEEYLRRAINIDPNEPDQYVFLGTTYFKQGRLADAAEQLRQGIARKPDGMGYHFTLGIIELQQGDLTSARAEMQRELAYHPEVAAARAQLQLLDRQSSEKTQ